ncbi:MAG: prealbumin-like fold domain-containing protein [Clostridiales bacterium]|jgi:hypothetical protein|nr:prealbumin-like fold domain-containing protein [Clostridiales bacterium]
MIKKKVMACLILGIILVSQAVVFANNETLAPSTSTVGQVTIHNVDKTDPSITLNGAQIRITNQETGAEYKDTIQYNGTVIFELPLGQYYLQQESAPDASYELDATKYEFVLQLPPGTNADNVKLVNTSVTMVNPKTGESLGADSIAIEEMPAQPAGTDISTIAAKNPATADFSWVTVSVTALAIAAFGVMICFVRRVKQY